DFWTSLRLHVRCCTGHGVPTETLVNEAPEPLRFRVDFSKKHELHQIIKFGKLVVSLPWCAPASLG
ncbi:MAG: hypothetical protein ACKOX7_10010, partial [Bacteroidota bacterium]